MGFYDTMGLAVYCLDLEPGCTYTVLGALHAFSVRRQ